MAPMRWQSLLGRLTRRRPTGPTLDVRTDVGVLTVHAGDQVITPVLRDEGRMPDADMELLRSLAPRDATVLDVGANIGYTTLLLADAVGPAGRVIAIEPHPGNAALLRRNLRRNGARQVEVIEAAAWRVPGEVDLSHSDENTGDHRVGALLDERPVLHVPAVRLDDVVPADADVRLVLADTQATEHVALEGAHALLARCRPTVLAEFWPSGIRVFGDDPLAVLAGYRALGYRLRLLEEPDAGPGDDAIVAAVDARPGPFGGFATLVLEPTA
jgi:FkbM family methyltransferase